MEGATVTAKSNEKWEIEEGARIFIRAQEIKADKKLWPKVQKELVKQAKAAKRAALEAKVEKGMKESFPED